MQKIVPHLWFDTQAKEAAAFYASVFPDSKVTDVTTIHGTPSGDCDIVSFDLCGQGFMAISAGPHFKFNPSISFHVKCGSKAEVDTLWDELSKGGTVLMPLGSYPFSERYGWLQDRYGLSWQLIFAGRGPIRQRITPVMMFVGTVCGKAEDAAQFYASVFPNSEADILARYGKDAAPDQEGSVQYVSLVLEGQEFGVMDSAHPHAFSFNEAISFVVRCDTQEEIDSYWGRLSAVPQAEQCGWLKDKYGVSWQITPTAMEEMMRTKDEQKLARVTRAFLRMKKFDIAQLKKAAEGR